MQAAIARLSRVFALNADERRLLSQLTLAGLVLLVLVAIALSIQVESKGKNFQTTTYTFEFLGGLKE